MDYTSTPRPLIYKDLDNIATSLQPGSIAIVKVGEKSIKVVLK